jgi:hypothetical protein
LFHDEKSDRTLTYLTVRPIHRFELVAVKYVAYLTVIPLFTALATFVTYLSFGIFGQFQYITTALWYFLVAIIASAVYGAFFMCMGLLWKRPLWFGLFFVFIWEFVFASFSVTLNQLTIAFYIKSIIISDIAGFESPAIIRISSMAGEFKASSNPASPLTFSMVSIILIIISLTLSWSILQGDKFKVPYQAGKRPGGWKYYLKEVRSFLITFAIVGIAIGIVFGPIQGLKTDYAKFNGATLSVNQYVEIDSPAPSMQDMGFGIYSTHGFSQGDTLTFAYSLQSVTHSNSSIHAVLLNPDDFFDFLSITQEMFWDYAQLIDGSAPSEPIYSNFVNNYSTVATNLLSKAIDSIQLQNQSIVTINLTVPRRTTYYEMVYITNFSTAVLKGFNAVVSTSVNGFIYRRTAFSIGVSLVAIGTIFGGFATYSLLTYSSEIEIKRYKQKVAEFEDRGLEAESLDEDNCPKPEPREK